MELIKSGGRPYPEYCLLMETEPIGKILGYLDGVPFYEMVRDQWGLCYRYTGVARRRPWGEIDFTVLRQGEFVVSSGLIYRVLLKGGTSSHLAFQLFSRFAKFLRRS